MSDKSHFELAHAIAKLVRARIATIYLEDSVRGIFDSDPVAQSRIFHGSKPFLRPLLAFSAFSLLNREASENGCPVMLNHLLPAMTAIELFNVSTYQTDDVFDYDIPSTEHNVAPNRVVREISSSHLSFALALREIVTWEEQSLERRIASSKLLHSASLSVYKGQVYQREETPLSSSLELAHDELLERYLRRCRLLDGEQIAASFLLGGVASSETKLVAKIIFDLYSIGNLFGMALQIINDIREFIPGDPNLGRDTACGVCTYPIYLHNQDKGFRNLSGEPSSDFILSDDTRERVFREVICLLKAIWQHMIEIMGRIKQEGFYSPQLDFLFPHIFRSRFLGYYSQTSSRLNRVVAKTKVDVRTYEMVSQILREVKLCL